MAGQHLPPDHTRGDADTIGGYMAVHARPAAFEGSDGYSYSVAIECDETGDPLRPWGAYFLFLRWRRMGPQGIDGHLESPFLAWGPEREVAIAALGAMRLNDVKSALDGLIRESGGGSGRKWWDVMREDG